MEFKKQFIESLLAYAAQRQVDPETLCSRSNIENSQNFKRANGNVTPTQMDDLWRNATQLSNDRLFGLHLGEAMQLSALGVVGQVILTSNTVGEALLQAGKLIYLITNVFAIDVSHSTNYFTISLTEDQESAIKFPHTYKHMGEYLLAFVIHELDGLMLRKIEPVSIEAPFEMENKEEYKRVLRTPDIAVAKSFKITFDSSYLSLPIISANHTLQANALKQIDTLLAESAYKGPWRDKVFNHLLANSYLNVLSLDDVAANFNLGARTLQRKLKNEGATFMEITEEVRKTLAIKYLNNGDHQVKEIAYALGYQDPSGFVRAFKRWTGKKPGHYATAG